MNDSYKKILECFSKGVWYTSPEEVDGYFISVEAIFLRDALLGCYADTVGSIKAIRLRSIKITGILDLRDCSGPEGTPLPPIILDQCILEGDIERPYAPSFSARHAYLARLSLSNCQFGRVDLSDALIEGDVAIDCVKRRNGTKLCQVSGRRAHIKGMLNARNARLRIPLDQKIPDFDISDSALDFADSTINGPIYLLKGFSAIGGVNFKGAKVGGDIWAMGVKIIGRAGEAFLLQRLKCDGGLSLDSEGKKKTIIRGNIDLKSARIRWLTLNNLCIRPAEISEDKKEIVAVDLSGSLIEQEVLAKRVNSKESYQKFPWGLAGNNAKIGGDVLVEYMDGSISFFQASLGGCLEVNKSNLRTLNLCGGVVEKSIYINANIIVNKNIYSIDASDLSVNHSIVLEVPPCHINLEGSKAGANLHITFIEMESDPPFSLIEAPNIGVDHNCILKNISGEAVLSNAVIGGNLDVVGAGINELDASGIKVVGSSSVSGVFAPEKIKQTINFQGSEIKGALHLERLKISQLGEFKPKITLEDSTVDCDFCVKSMSVVRESRFSWANNEAIEVRFGNLSFYPGWKLYEFLFIEEDKDRQLVVSYLYNESTSYKQKSIILSGLSSPIHELNATSLLKIDKEEEALEYLKFFCCYVWADEGPFKLVLSPEELPFTDLPGLDQIPFSPTLAKNGDRWNVNAIVLYGRNLFGCEFEIEPTGKVNMLDDNPIPELEKDNPEGKDSGHILYLPPYRAIKRDTNGYSNEKLFWVEKIAHNISKIESPDQCKKLLFLIMGEEDITGNIAEAILSLSGLSVGSLRYEKLNDWGSGIEIELDGFEYKRVEDRESTKEMFAKSGGGDLYTYSVNDRIAWLNKQFPQGSYKNHPKGKLFTPQPHEFMASILKARGEAHQAKQIILNKLKLERELNYGFFKKITSLFMDVFFKHGLFASRGIICCAVLLAAGALCFNHMNYGYDKPILVVNTALTNFVVQNNEGDKLEPVTLLGKNETDFISEIRCGDQIDSTLYAIDVFIPLLELRQEEKCSITTDPMGDYFEWFKGLYSIIGAIFTSLTLLTLTGVLRRHTEH